MKFVMCLGNPGAQYEDTRHNAGFMLADELALRLGGTFLNEAKFKSHILKAEYKSETLWIIKPQTFMNLSGEAFAAYKNFYKFDISSLFVIYDDISLELGRIRFRQDGSSGGHNGIKSIINHAGSQKFGRLKIGIGPQPAFMKSEDYVLQKFSSDERVKLKNTVKTAADAFLYCMEYGAAKAQNKYN